MYNISGEEIKLTATRNIVVEKIENDNSKLMTGKPYSQHLLKRAFMFITSKVDVIVSKIYNSS